MEPRAEVRGDDQLVLEPIGARQEIIEMCVAELVDLVRQLGLADEGHLHDEHLGAVDVGEGVQSLRGGVAEIRDLRDADLGRDLDARQPQVADLLDRQARVLGLELLAPLPHEEADRRDRVLRREDRDDQLARQLDLLPRLHADEPRRQGPAVELLERAEQLFDRLDRAARHVDRRRLHPHHPPPRHVDGQGRDVVEVRVREEPVRRAHERPRLHTQVEPELHLGDPPVRLHRRRE